MHYIHVIRSYNDVQPQQLITTVQYKTAILYKGKISQSSQHIILPPSHVLIATVYLVFGSNYKLITLGLPVSS